ncbi:MAG TPA: DnaJ domain-containing protein [Acidimicrobiales bacterium]
MDNPYDVLKVAEDAPLEVIHASYRALCRRYHPDTGAGDEEVVRALNDAWERLRSPESRAKTDRDLARQRADEEQAAAQAAATLGQPGWGEEVDERPTWSERPVGDPAPPPSEPWWIRPQEPPPAAPAPTAPLTPPENEKAKIATWVALAGLVIPVVALVGLVLGIIAVREINHSDGRQSGSKRAWVAIGLAAFGLLFAFR